MWPYATKVSYVIVYLVTIEIYIAIFIQVTNNDIVIFINYWTNRIEKQPEFPCRM